MKNFIHLSREVCAFVCSHTQRFLLSFLCFFVAMSFSWAQSSEQAIKVRLQPGQTTTRQLTVLNQAVSDLAYKTMVRQTAVSLTTPGESSVTFGGSNHTEKLYATGFEDFAAGEFVSESGWDSEFGSTDITDQSPANGAQHLKLTPQEFGGTYRVRAFSPLTEKGDSPFASASVKAQLNADGSGFFAILPLTAAPDRFSRYLLRLSRNSAQININSFGWVTVSDFFTEVEDGPNTFRLVQTGYRVSEEYVHITYVVDRSTRAFSLFINDELIYEGTSALEGDIEGLLIAGVSQEEPSITFNIDDVAILDGDAGAPDWVFTSQLSGTIAAQEEANINVTLNASNLAPGTYQAQVRVLPRDANEAVVTVPVTLIVEEPKPTVVNKLNLTSMCSDNPEEELRWRIRNPNDFAVEVSWQVYGTPQQDVVMAPPGDSFFFTQTNEGPNTTIIRWKDEEGRNRQKIKASGKAACQPPQPLLQVYPVPVQNELNIMVQNTDKGVITIYNQNGEVVYSREITADQTLNLKADNLKLAPQQLYTIALQTGDNRVVQRVMVE